MATSSEEESLEYRIKRIQRWIDAPQTGNLNDPETVAELEADIVGLKDYLSKKRAEQAVVAAAPPTRPEGGFATVVKPTPNFRGDLRPEGVVFHHSSGSLESNIGWITRDSVGTGSACSYHVLIDTDGTRYQFVPFHKRAWHAGKSTFRGRSGCNAFMAGISFTGSTYDRQLTDLEIASAVDLVAVLANQYQFGIDWITDHRTIAPERRDDLNPVEFQRLRNALKRVL